MGSPSAVPETLHESGASKTETLQMDGELGQDNATSSAGFVCGDPEQDASPASPCLDADNALAHVKRWIDEGRPGPFLSIHCTPEVFMTATRLLDSQGSLPRLARDYDPATMT